MTDTQEKSNEKAQNLMMDLNKKLPVTSRGISCRSTVVDTMMTED